LIFIGCSPRNLVDSILFLIQCHAERGRMGEPDVSAVPREQTVRAQQLAAEPLDKRTESKHPRMLQLPRLHQGIF
jgi:hypothetical protein